ncbi:C-type lectin domain family 5 member A isoform X1 [Manis pentadactyla]|uniref:C-type lectin domain family 5 member A isoform X1 n=1 Tax=Manis pentadactyla TaxID=143292 RepID=UPI00255C3DEC|nr:C-type lectin domain family 5 member A isoform X1 [Manis pentadactyla]
MEFFPQRGQKDLLIQSLHVTDRETETRLVKFLPGLRMICINMIVINRPVSHYLMTQFQDSHSETLISYSVFLISLVCPREWDLHEGRCFFLSTSELSWNKSREFCEAEGSSLAIVNTPAKLEFLQDRTGAEKYFIGLLYQHAEEGWYWIDNSMFNGNVVNQRLHFNCVTIGLTKTYDAASCDVNYRWICEKRAT